MSKLASRQRRGKRITKEMLAQRKYPTISIHRSAQHIYAQLLDETNERVICSASTLEKALREKLTGSKTERATAVGQALAERALAKGIKKAVFDRRGFKYHGRVKALADGARDGGIDI